MLKISQLIIHTKFKEKSKKKRSNCSGHQNEVCTVSKPIHQRLALHTGFTHRCESTYFGFINKNVHSQACLAYVKYQLGRKTDPHKTDPCSITLFLL